MSETFSDRRASLTEQEGGTRRSPLRDFLHGAALIFDFGGRLGRRGITTTRHPSDASRLEADWWAVGNDMRRAMGQPPVKHPTS
ncbi:hypothetical protein [Candidatus Poriferisodalis sp.]|uniref:hypothetical protein n=1 Tax=Candidatus Poriferisodalis sp. TaxID=3101277 RepID=UPI003B51ED80